MNLVASITVFLAIFIATSTARRRVYNGEETPIMYFPYIVSVTFRNSPVGAGVILAAHYVLTSARIVAKRSHTSLKVVYGSSKPNEGKRGTVATLHAVFIHPDYAEYGNSQLHDLAILRTNRFIKYTPNSKPVVLRDVRAHSNEPARVGGWGHSEVGHYTPSLRVAKVKIEHMSVCREKHPAGPINYDDSLLCVASHGPCHGDAGAPLLVGTALVGIASYRLGGCNSTDPTTMYTNLQYASHKNFINTVAFGQKWGCH